MKKVQSLTSPSTLWWGMAIIVGFLWFSPILWLIISPFKPTGHPVLIVSQLWEGGWTIDNFIKLWIHPHYKLWLSNSFVVAISHSILSTFIAALAAYAFSQISFRGKKFLYLFLFCSFLIPGETILIPLFKLVVLNLKLGNSFLGIILPGLANVFSLVVIKNYFDSIPSSYSEAARLDGASNLQIFIHIYLPMSAGIISTMTVLAFIASWNSFIWPLLVLNDASQYTLPVGLPQFLGGYVATDLTLPMAANLIAALPTVIYFLIFQNKIVSNQIDGGVKQ